MTGWLTYLRSPINALPVAIFLAALALPWITDDEYLLDSAVFILLWAAAAGAWNICGGYAGQLSLGHAAFFGMGAYTSTLLFVELSISPWLGMLTGAVLAALIAAILAYLANRLRGPYFALATLAFAEVALVIASRWYGLTRGGEGLPVPFRPGWQNFMFYSKTAWLYIILGLVILVWGISLTIEQTRLGYYLAALREDEEAARSLGIKTRRLKVVAVSLSAFLTALVGTFYAQYVGFVDPFYVLSTDLSVRFALMTIIGGMAVALGPLLGSGLITSLEMYLRASLGGAQSGLYLVVYGALLIIVVLFIPGGIVAAGVGLSRRLRGKDDRRVA
jgi:branched-chain amino acid transport system permease protein